MWAQILGQANERYFSVTLKIKQLLQVIDTVVFLPFLTAPPTLTMIYAQSQMLKKELICMGVFTFTWAKYGILKWLSLIISQSKKFMEVPECTAGQIAKTIMQNINFTEIYNAPCRI